VTDQSPSVDCPCDALKVHSQSNLPVIDMQNPGVSNSTPNKLSKESRVYEKIDNNRLMTIHKDLSTISRLLPKWWNW
jgi:hypothetical protein